MSTVRVTVDTSRLKRKVARYLGGLLDVHRQAATLSVQPALEELQITLPRDSGRLAASWAAVGAILGLDVGDVSAGEVGDAVVIEETTIDGTALTLQSAVPYAPYIEYGTTRIAPGGQVAAAMAAAQAAPPRAAIAALYAAAWEAA